MHDQIKWKQKLEMDAMDQMIGLTPDQAKMQLEGKPITLNGKVVGRIKSAEFHPADGTMHVSVDSSGGVGWAQGNYNTSVSMSASGRFGECFGEDKPRPEPELGEEPLGLPMEVAPEPEFVEVYDEVD